MTTGQRRADALALVAESALAADLDRGTTGDRYQVVVQVESATLRTYGESGAPTSTDGQTVLWRRFDGRVSWLCSECADLLRTIGETDDERSETD